ncbi:nucleoside diphosphate kinase regulator [Sphingobium aromaticiconvertens]|uniref:nucleoside diphosphate kinase regulator n=1 Tax=Sphingobium aromaticiconvertens TaxID=365341 RepID=UPI003017C33E
MSKPQTAAKRPPLHLIESEADTLSDLAWGARDRFPNICIMLLDEIGRAKLCKPSNLPDDVVAMSSRVDYIDEGSGTRRSITLVYPNHADAVLGRVSILTPVGAGLIGVKAGHSILWPDRDGRQRQLTVVSVQQNCMAH